MPQDKGTDEHLEEVSKVVERLRRLNSGPLASMQSDNADGLQALAEAVQYLLALESSRADYRAERSEY